MKIRLASRSLPNSTNSYRVILSDALHSRHHPSILVSKAHMPRRQIRLTPTKSPRERCFSILHLHVLPHRPRTILWLIQKDRNLKNRGHTVFSNHTNCLHGICPSLRSNVFLSRYGHNKFSFRHPLHRNHNSSMTMRRILRRQSNLDPIFCLPLSFSVHNCRPGNYSPRVSTQKGS